MIINSEPDMIVIDAAATGGEAVARLSARTRPTSR